MNYFGNPRRCFVDGIEYRNVPLAANALGISKDSLAKRIKRHGRIFDLNGHHFEAEKREQVKQGSRECKRYTVDTIARPPTPEPLERIRGSRRLYDNRGKARGACS